jgi:hypothetical protein
VIPSQSAFVVLWRAFLSQFLASESVSSDVQLRRTIIWVLAFLVTPVLYLTAIVLPTFEIVRLVAAARHAPEMIEEMLANLSVLYVSYSMVITGLMTAFVWDALNFDRRDAMVLGPLPVSGWTIIAAKLAALSTFLLGASVAVNTAAGVPYALITGGNDGLARTIWHLTAFLAATVGGAVFVFSAIVATRAVIQLLVGAHNAARLGSVMQFVAVSAVLSFFLVPAAIGNTQPVFIAATAADWMPTNWYFGLFEQLRGASPGRVAGLAHRAAWALPIAVGCGVATTALSFWHQMQSALAPEQPAHIFPLLQVRRRIGRLIVGHDCGARGVMDFVLMTLSSSSEHRAYMGIGAAIAVGVVSVALSRNFDGVASLMWPRTVVLWIPLVFGYWIAVGLRASFFAPSNVQAAWAFYVNAQSYRASYWSGVRGAMLPVVLLPTLAVNVVVVGTLLGWKVAAWHMLLVSAVLILTVQVLSLTIDFVPYTRPYEPGHARLKTRWPLYLLGMFLVAYVPVQVELALFHRPRWLLLCGTVTAVAIVIAEIAGHRSGRAWEIEPSEWEDSEAVTTLNIGNVSRSTLA